MINSNKSSSIENVKKNSGKSSTIWSLWNDVLRCPPTYERCMKKRGNHMRKNCWRRKSFISIFQMSPRFPRGRSFPYSFCYVCQVRHFIRIQLSAPYFSALTEGLTQLKQSNFTQRWFTRIHEGWAQICQHQTWKKIRRSRRSLSQGLHLENDLDHGSCLRHVTTLGCVTELG